MTGVAGVYATTWEWRGNCFWTLVNRCDNWRRRVPVPSGARECFDVMARKLLDSDSSGIVKIDIPPRGLGAVFAGGFDSSSTTFAAFLTWQANAWCSISEDATNVQRENVSEGAASITKK